MALHQKAFWCISFFLIGVLAAGILRSAAHPLLVSALVGALCSTAFFIIKGRLWGLLSLVFILGVLYSAGFNAWRGATVAVPLNESREFSGIVKKVSRSDRSQRVDISLNEPHRGRVRAYLREYPSTAYGDELKFTGVFKAVAGESEGYFLKENISAVMSFPGNVEIIGRGKGFAFKAILLGFRDSVEASFHRMLSPEQATLMTGLVLGKSGGFSEELSEKLRLTGTTHLVALSGMNIGIIIRAIGLLLGLFASRRLTVYGSILATGAFVLMTGAEASVVRAAIMAAIVIIAERTSRMHSARHAIAVTGLVMVLANPNILAFDIGFQLSFLALIGIVYLQPLLMGVCRTREGKGFLGWRENFWMTISAQAAVLPILLANFGFFAPIAVVTNVLLASAIPMTMLFGALIFFTGLLNDLAALVAVIPARLLLGYELAVIDIFSKFSFGIQVESFPVIFGLLYYAALALFMAYASRRFLYASKAF